MEISFEKYELCQKYLDGNMSQPEEIVFLEEVQRDPLLAEHLKLEEELLTALLLKEMDTNFESFGFTAGDFEVGKTSISSDTDNEKESTDTSSNYGKQKAVVRPLTSRKAFYLAAASVAVIIVSGAIFFSLKKQQHNQDLANTNRSKPDSAKLRPIQNPAKKDLQTATAYATIADQYYLKDKSPEEKPQLLAEMLDEYADNYYDHLQKVDFEKLPQTRSINDDFIKAKELGFYYQGISYIETKDYVKAKEDFRWIISHSKNTTLLVKALWYQSIVYLKTNDIEKTKINLERIIKMNASKEYVLKSQQLLKSISQ